MLPTTEPYATSGQQKKNYKRSAAITSTSICGLLVVDRRNPKAMWSRAENKLFVRGGRRFLVTKISACRYTGLNDRDSKSGVACVRQVMSETKHVAPSLLISTR